MTADQKAGAFVFAAKGAPEKRDGSDDDDDDDKPDAQVNNKAQPGKATEAKSPDTRSSDAKSDKPDDDDDAPKTLEQRYEARYPQDARVSDLVGKPLLETNNVSIGRIESVARTSDGRFLLIVPYGGFLGHGQHRVAVRLEAVASIGTALISVDQDRAGYDNSPAWRRGTETILHAEDPIRVAITRH